ncbi:hypothetical protein D3C74_317840 [compost metagenome]
MVNDFIFALQDAAQFLLHSLREYGQLVLDKRARQRFNYRFGPLHIDWRCLHISAEHAPGVKTDNHEQDRNDNHSTDGAYDGANDCTRQPTKHTFRRTFLG